MRLPDGSGVPVACAVPVVPTVPAAGQSVSFRRFRLLVPFPVLPAFPVLSCPSCTFRSSRPLLSLSRCFGRRTIPPVSAVCRPCPPPAAPLPVLRLSESSLSFRILPVVLTASAVLSLLLSGQWLFGLQQGLPRPSMPRSFWTVSCHSPVLLPGSAVHCKPRPEALLRSQDFRLPGTCEPPVAAVGRGS